MSKVVLVFANCQNTNALGDFSLAGGIAHDLALELLERNQEPIEVMLASTKESVDKYHRLYAGNAKDGYVDIQGIRIRVTALESFDTVEHQVVAFIEANYCKSAPDETIHRVLSPKSKFLYVGAANQSDNSKTAFLSYLYNFESQMASVYCSKSDIFVANCSVGPKQLGLPNFPNPSEIPEVVSLRPTSNYGILYLNNCEEVEDLAAFTAQYMTVMPAEAYVLVGSIADDPSEKFYFQQIVSIKTHFTIPPQIHYLPSLPNLELRALYAHAPVPLCGSTGVMNTLELMEDGKLPYYQLLDENKKFVLAFRNAVNNLVKHSPTVESQRIQALFGLLMLKKKPLSLSNEALLINLLEDSKLREQMIDINRSIVEQSKGRVAPKLLNFLREPSSVSSNKQLNLALDSLKRTTDLSNEAPNYGRALLRAANWGKVLELKVLLYWRKKHAIEEDILTATDGNKLRTALHWSIAGKQFDCFRLLVNSDAGLDFQDRDGLTPVDLLLNNLKNPEEPESPSLGLALRRAAASDCDFELKAMLYLMRRGKIDIGIVDATDEKRFHRSALHWAVIKGKFNAVRLLISAGAELNLEDINKKTPYQYALEEGNMATVQLLLQHGAIQRNQMHAEEPSRPAYST